MLKKLHLVSVPIILATILITSATMALPKAYSTPTNTTTNETTITGSTSTGPITLDTANGAIRIQITQDPQTIPLNQPVKFILDFLDPLSNQAIQHVNYDFSILDEQQKPIVLNTALHTHTGNDIQSVTFDNPGSFSLVINVIGTGINEPFDTTQSGIAATDLAIPGQ